MILHFTGNDQAKQYCQHEGEWFCYQEHTFRNQFAGITMSRVSHSACLSPWLIVNLVISCLHVAAASAGETNGPQSFTGEMYTPQVTIQQQTSDGVTPYATRYHVSLDECSIIWIAYDTELDRGVVKYQSDCSMPLAGQRALLKRICASFLSNDRNAPAFRTLFWGTLFSDSAAGSWEMSFRLALAAFRSPEWNKASGKNQRKVISTDLPRSFPTML
jgi:hypothetical protein